MKLCRHFFCVVALCASVFAQTNKSAVGIWKFDSTKSDLGREAAPKSLTITVLKDTPQLISWRVSGEEHDGTPFAYWWHGPADGSMHPVMSKTGKQGIQSAKKEQDGSLLRHGEEADGSSFDARSIISDDGNSMTDEITTKSKDGQETKQKYAYNRVKGKTAK